MNYRVWFDEKTGMVKAKVLRGLTGESAREMMEEIERTLVKTGVRRGIMDLTETEVIRRVPREVRQVYREHAERLSLDRAGILVSSPVMRMTAKVILSALGKSDKARFFKSEAQALKWLKEGA